MAGRFVDMAGVHGQIRKWDIVGFETGSTRKVRRRHEGNRNGEE